MRELAMWMLSVTVRTPTCSTVSGHILWN